MMIYFKGVLSSLYHGGPNDVPNRTEGRDANNQHNRIDIEEAVYSDSEKIFLQITFLAVQDSSIGDLVTHSLTHSLTD